MNSADCRLIFSGIVSLVALSLAGPAYAACDMPDNPPGTPAPNAAAGDLVFNEDDSVMQYCNGTAWKSATGSGGVPACADGQTLQYDDDDSRWLCVGADEVGDNLGNHTATANLRLGAFYLSGDGDPEGVAVDASGNVGIGVAPAHKLHVNGNIGIAAGGYFNFGATSGTTGYGIRDNAGVIEVKNSGGSWLPL